MRVGVITTAAGQGCTHVAVALAWEWSGQQPTVVVDADPGVGTVAELMALEPELRLSGVWGPTGITATALQSVITTVPARRQLGVVAGFESVIAEWPQVIAGVAPALPQLNCELVVVDLGAPFGATRGAPPLGQVLGVAFDVVVLVLRSDPDLLWRSIRLLAGGPLPRTRVVLMRPEGERGGQAAALLRREVPWLPTVVEWPMDRAAMLAAAEDHRPVLRAGGLCAALGIGGAVKVTERRRRGLWAWRRSAPETGGEG